MRHRHRHSRHRLLAVAMLVLAALPLGARRALETAGTAHDGVPPGHDRTALPADTAGVRAAVLDYVEAIYRSDPDRIRRSVDSTLTKLGHVRGNSSDAYTLRPMSYAQLLQVARTWNRDGRVDPERAPREVLVHAVFDRTASATLFAEWGVDLLQLHNVDGRWRIVHVLWQTSVREGG